LGILNLKKGYYYYVGSAQKNLIQRIERHKRKRKKLHWHIDYLTTHSNISITNTLILENAAKQEECVLVSKLISLEKFSHPIKNFGNSDCNICESHLLYSATKLNRRYIEKSLIYK